MYASGRQPGGRTAGRAPRGARAAILRCAALATLHVVPASAASDGTDAERAVWRLLRNRQFSAAKFRRQHPIGRYVVDFYCHEHRLVIEIDGGQHAPERDARRTAFLTRQGLTVLRFWNNEVLGNPEGVEETILRALDGG